VPRKQKKVVPKLDMETPSLANIEVFEWKQQIENAKGDPAKLREIEEQHTASLIKQRDVMLQQCEQLLLPLLDKYEIPYDAPNRWLVLAFLLAADSGKLNARPAHAPTKRNDITDRQLCKRVFAATAQIAEERGCEIDSVPDIEACRRIRDHHSEWYKTKKGRPLDPSTLQKTFRQALLREAVRHFLHTRKEVLPT
jgi:hypothetical protein